MPADAKISVLRRTELDFTLLSSLEFVRGSGFGLIHKRAKTEFIRGLRTFTDLIPISDGRKITWEICLTLLKLLKVIHNSSSVVRTSDP